MEQSKAAAIRVYMKQHPKAKVKDVATATGATLANVYATLAYDKKAKKGIPRVPRKSAKVAANKWKNIQIGTTGASMAGIEVGGLRLTELADGKMRWVKAALEGGPTEEELNAPDNVNHPSHYKVGGIETIDFIEAKKLGYNLGNVVKYLTRADHKGNKLEDLRKAQWYLTREISMLK
jgi:hypothetical protein